MQLDTTHKHKTNHSLTFYSPHLSIKDDTKSLSETDDFYYTESSFYVNIVLTFISNSVGVRVVKGRTNKLKMATQLK